MESNYRNVGVSNSVIKVVKEIIAIVSSFSAFLINDMLKQFK